MGYAGYIGGAISRNTAKHDIVLGTYAREGVNLMPRDEYEFWYSVGTLEDYLGN